MPRGLGLSFLEDVAISYDMSASGVLGAGVFDYGDADDLAVQVLTRC